MSGVVLICLGIRLFSLFWAFRLLTRLRDRRLWLFILAFGVLFLDLAVMGVRWPLSLAAGGSLTLNDLLCLGVSLCMLAAVLSVGRILRELRYGLDEAATKEASLRDFIEASSDRYWEMDRDLRFVWARESTKKQRLPYVEYLIGKTRWELFNHDPDKDVHWRRHRDDLLNRRPFRDFRYSVTAEKDKTRHWSVSGKPVFLADGSFRGYRGTATEVTEQVEQQARTEQALRRSEQRFRDFAGVASDWFWETDPDLRFSFISDRPEGEKGVRAQDFLGKRYDDLAISAPGPAALRDHLKDLEERREFRNFVYSLSAADGTLHHYRVSGRPLFDEDQRFLGYRGVGTDITAEVEAERQRQQAEIRLARSIDVIPAGFALYDEDDRLVICNKEYRECYLALGVEARRGVSFKDLVRAVVDSVQIGPEPEDADAWARRRLLRRSEPAQGYEYRHSGTRWSEVSDYLLPDGGVITLAQDITDRKLTEEALRISEQHFRNVVEGSQQGIFIFKDSEFLFVNQAYADMLGYTPEEIYALDPPHTAYAPYERERMRQYGTARLRGDPVPNSYEVDALRKDGTIITLHHFAKRAEWYGEPISQVAVMDVTDRKRTEQELLESQTKQARYQQRLLDAIECMNDGFVLYDEEDRMVLCNAKFNDFYDLSPELLKPGTRFEDQIRWSASLGAIADAVGQIEEWAERRMDQHRNPKGPFERRLSDGRWLQINEMRTKEGGIVGIGTDITRLKEAEEANRSHEAELARVQRRSTMGEMAAALAHELNQPLTAVANYCSGCLRRIESGAIDQEELAEVISSVREQAQRASDILRHIGGFVTEGETDKTMVDVNDAIRRVMTLLDGELQRNKIEVKLRLGNNLPKVHAAQIGIEQVVLNIAKNAIEAMQEVPASERTLKISTSKRAPGRVAVAVSDSGPSFAAAKSEAYFEPFISTKKQGMGMGLAICRSIISALGGRIRMKKNRRAAGTTVSFALPTAGEAMKDAA